MEDIISVTGLWLLVSCVCSGIYIVHERGKTVAHPFIQLSRRPLSDEVTEVRPALKAKILDSGGYTTGKLTQRGATASLHVRVIVAYDCGTSDVDLPKSTTIFKEQPFTELMFSLLANHREPCQPAGCERRRGCRSPYLCWKPVLGLLLVLRSGSGAGA